MCGLGEEHPVGDLILDTEKLCDSRGVMQQESAIIKEGAREV